ncbi:unnamed protein product, partial [Pylaiella littoralis]
SVSRLESYTVRSKSVCLLCLLRHLSFSMFGGGRRELHRPVIYVPEVHSFILLVTSRPLGQKQKQSKSLYLIISSSFSPLGVGRGPSFNFFPPTTTRFLTLREGGGR